MVKVQKPNPKSLKNDISAKAKNIPVKNSKLISSKEKGKVIGKTLEKVGKNAFVKELTPKVADLKFKSKNVIKKDKKIAQTKKPAVKNVENKSEPIKSEVQHKNQKSVQKKKVAVETVAKKNQTVKKAVSEKKQKFAPKKTQTVNKVQDKKKENQNVKEPKKKGTRSKPLFEAVNFENSQFEKIVKLENLQKISQALKTLVEKQVSEKKTSIFSDYRYMLNVCSFKIPNCPKRMVKLNVKHSLVDTKKDDVAFIVPDLQRGAKVDYEPTIQHYEDLLREIGEENIKVIPFNQLRNEYTTFDAKRKLSNTYDYFLCDGRIVSHVVGFCGKHFQKPRSTFHAVRMNNREKIKSDLEHALKRTSFKQLNKGDLISIPVGSDHLKTNQVAENIEVVIEQLKTLFPGGYANIRSIYLKIDIKGTSALPIYISMAEVPAETPNVIGNREQKLLKLKKQSNDILAKFNMTKTGEFVQLNKTQVERKRQIREARTELLSKDDNNAELQPPTKKAKGDKKIEKVDKIDEESNANEENNDDIEEDSDDVDQDSDAIDEDGDANEEDNEEDGDDDEEDGDDDEEDGDDDEKDGDDDDEEDGDDDDEEEDDDDEE